MNGDIVSLVIYIGYFIIGSVIGYFIELIYRIIKEKRIVNPGFFIGPYLPIYGFGLIILNFIPDIICIKSILILGLISTILITTLEYFSGVFFVIKMKIPLWDYSNKIGNFRGIICVEFMLYWFLLSCLYYLFFYKIIKNVVIKMIKNDYLNIIIIIFEVLFIFDIVINIIKNVKKRL